MTNDRKVINNILPASDASISAALRAYHYHLLLFPIFCFYYPSIIYDSCFEFTLSLFFSPRTQSQQSRLTVKSFRLEVQINQSLFHVFERLIDGCKEWRNAEL